MKIQAAISSDQANQPSVSNLMYIRPNHINKWPYQPAIYLQGTNKYSKAAYEGTSLHMSLKCTTGLGPVT